MSSPATNAEPACQGQRTEQLPPDTAGEQPPAADGASGSNGGKKRRAALACLPCRKRKVRCNILEQSPCGNCLWDKSECVVAKPRRRRQAALFFEQRAEIPTTSSRTDQGHASIPAPLADGEPLITPAEETQPLPASSSEDFQPSSRPVTLDDDSENRGAFSLRTSEQDAVLSSLDHVSSTIHIPQSKISYLTRPVLARIPAEDAAYLSVKGALTIPRGTACSALLDSYISYVHPHLPILNTEELSDVLKRDQNEVYSESTPDASQEDSGSLLLVQAVMFAAMAFVDNEHIQNMGFYSRRQARKYFFEKAKLLYNLDCEQDHLAIAQALLLMTFWHETMDDEKDSSHWIGLVINLTGSINEEALSPSKIKLLKRIRWCCVLRDSHISLGMRRPMKTDISTLDDPGLALAAFDTTSPDLANLFISRCRLCLIIARILKTQYVLENRKTHSMMGHSVSSTMLLYPKRIPDHNSVETIEGTLIEWQNSLPDCYRLRPLSNTALGGVAPPEFLLPQIVLQMEYETAVGSLYRPSAQAPAEAFSIRNVKSRTAYQLRTVQAAQNVAIIASEVNTLGLGRFLPNSAMTALMPCMMTLVVEWKRDAGKWTSEKTLEQIRQCYRLQKSLQDIYNVADVGADLLRAAMGSDAFVLDAVLPMPVEPPPLQNGSPSGSSDEEPLDSFRLNEVTYLDDADSDTGDLMVTDDAWSELKEWGNLAEGWAATGIPGPF